MTTHQAGASPRTEAGRALRDACDWDHGRSIVAIEAEARQQVVETVKDFIILQWGPNADVDPEATAGDCAADILAGLAALSVAPDEARADAAEAVPDPSILAAILDDVPKTVANTINFDGEGLAAWIVGHWSEYAAINVRATGGPTPEAAAPDAIQRPPEPCHPSDPHPQCRFGNGPNAGKFRPWHCYAVGEGRAEA